MNTPHPLASPEALFGQLEHWVQAGWLRALDLAFARFLQEVATDAPPALLLAAALVSHQSGRGHVCLDVRQLLANPEHTLSLPPEGDALGIPPARPSRLLAGLDAHAWEVALARPDLVAEGEGNTPLVYREGRLYLRRYWRYEQRIQAHLGRRLASPLPVEDAALAESLHALFPPGDAPAPDWQKIACALAARARFAVITGGPGTGKTTTVVKLLAVLQRLALRERGRALRIRLAAPTGKAAARLNASIASQIQALPLHALPEGDTLRSHIPTEVSTLHRLLGPLPESRHFRHHADNPLAADVVVVDEASMVDVEMMANLLDALPAHTRLILLGDKDQLASVEAGAVLGDLCRRADHGHYTRATREWLQQVCGETLEAGWEQNDGTPLDQSVAMLRHSWRFGGDSGIGQLARAVNNGDPTAALKQLAQPQPGLHHLRISQPGAAALERLLVEGSGQGVGYRAYLARIHDESPPVSAPRADFDAWAARVLDAHGRFQMLCALRRGEWGVEGMNQRVATLLHAQGLISATTGWYLGRPVLVTRNDYSLRLMNGDIGLTLHLPVPGPDGHPVLSLRVAFPTGDGSGGIRWFMPGRLAEVETVYAMTVHKSQGSEFEHTALVLPDRATPILTRELVYTGITRARGQFTLVDSNPAVLEHAIHARVERVGGGLV